MMWLSSCLGAVEVMVVARFNMNGVSGVIKFMQSPRFDNWTVITVSLSGLDQYPSETFPWSIHNYPFTTQQRDPCSAASVGGHFDPFMASNRPNYTAMCSSNRSLCEVGDLSGKFENLPSSNMFHVDDNLPLYGVHSIVGRSVVIHRSNGDRWVCANVEYPGNVTVAYSPFRANLIGSIFFIEPYPPMNLSTVFVQLSYISGSLNSTSHNWHVHRNVIGDSGDCGDGGPHYNPRGIVVDSPDYLYCSPANQTACEIGDLTGKGSQLNFTDSRTISFYTDTELPLRINTLGETILRRSVVIHASNAGADRIACANLIEYTPRVAIARFEEDGVTGEIVFSQSSPFSPTAITVKLNGLSSRADGYHVHEFPVDETIPGSSKCTAAGGHYNPRNIIRNSSSPTTFDAYEIGDLSGKFGGLIGLNSTNSTYADPYLSLFGIESIVGRSVVIHYLNGDLWLCANILYDMETVSITAGITTDSVQGRLVLTQLANDPFSETMIFLDFNIGPPVVSSSRAVETPTLTQLFTSASTMSSSPMTSLSTSMSSTTTSSSTSLVLSTTTTTANILSSSTVLPTPDSTSMATTTSVMSTSSVMTSAMATTSRSSITTNATTTIAPTMSSVVDKPTTDDKLPATSTKMSITSNKTTTSSVSSTSQVNPSTLDIGSGFMLSSSMPSPSPTDKPDGRKKKYVFKRQAGTPVMYLSVQNGCEPDASLVNPYSASSSCSPDNQLACPVGDLTGKHGPLSLGRNLLTDLNLPLTGPNSSKWQHQY